jgi:hypothetical protein
VLGGFVADRLGRRVAILGTLVLTAIAAPASFVMIGQGHVLPGRSSASCRLASSSVPISLRWLTRSRGRAATSGIGLAYNIGYAVVGGGVPTLSALMLKNAMPLLPRLGFSERWR